MELKTSVYSVEYQGLATGEHKGQVCHLCGQPVHGKITARVKFYEKANVRLLVCQPCLESGGMNLPPVPQDMKMGIRLGDRFYLPQRDQKFIVADVGNGGGEEEQVALISLDFGQQLTGVPVTVEDCFNLTYQEWKLLTNRIAVVPLDRKVDICEGQ